MYMHMHKIYKHEWHLPIENYNIVTYSIIRWIDRTYEHIHLVHDNSTDMLDTIIPSEYTQIGNFVIFIYKNRQPPRLQLN